MFELRKLRGRLSDLKPGSISLDGLTALNFAYYMRSLK